MRCNKRPVQAEKKKYFIFVNVFVCILVLPKRGAMARSKRNPRVNGLPIGLCRYVGIRESPPGVAPKRPPSGILPTPPPDRPMTIKREKQKREKDP